MDFKNLLLHLDHSSGCRNRLKTAFALARTFGAKITGLFIVPDYIVPSYVEAQISVDVITDVTEKALARAADTLLTYRQLAAEAEIEMNAEVHSGQAIPLLREYSKYADLLILGQDQPDDPDNASYGLADALLFEGGCACLVVPHSGNPVAPGKRVLLTWNASRESARALRESMPLLARAESVVVAASEPDNTGSSLFSGRSHAEELNRLLRSHGIDAQANDISETNIGISDTIIAQAADMDADLIVMGAYGHARLREIILGGVTRDLLKLAPLPLLLTH